MLGIFTSDATRVTTTSDKKASERQPRLLLSIVYLSPISEFLPIKASNSILFLCACMSAFFASK